VKEQIRSAFAHVEYPGDWCIRGGDEGEEPYLIERDFRGKTDWRLLDPEFIDQSPDGLGSALSFLSDEAFHFYLPAYLIADIDGRLKHSNPLFHLTHGLDDSSRGERINPRRFGDRTWCDAARYKFAMFTKDEASAIVGYLQYKAETDPDEQESVEASLRNYWNEKIANKTIEPYR